MDKRQVTKDTVFRLSFLFYAVSAFVLLLTAGRATASQASESSKSRCPSMRSLNLPDVAAFLRIRIMIFFHKSIRAPFILLSAAVSVILGNLQIDAAVSLSENTKEGLFSFVHRF